MTTSINFEFLRERWPGLAALGGFAEAYAASDPASALMKLRRFGEEATAYIYRAHRLLCTAVTKQANGSSALG